LVDRAFGGSANALVVQALAGAAVTDEERDEIRRMLDRAEEGNP
jgi:predicted transcriptional regulator